MNKNTTCTFVSCNYWFEAFEVVKTSRGRARTLVNLIGSHHHNLCKTFQNVSHSPLELGVLNTSVLHFHYKAKHCQESDHSEEKV